MNEFNYSRASDQKAALTLISAEETASFIAGGTTLVDLMKLNVQAPSTLVDINALPLDRIEAKSDGSLSIDSMVRMSDAANHPFVKEMYPVVSEALLAGASPQLRNMASIGGNLMQRTRCYYFRDTAFECNKRVPGSGCPAINGFNRIHAVLGTSESCIATHPSDLCVALSALDAVIRVAGAGGAEKTIPINEFYLEPDDTPHKENLLQHDELITAVDIPPLPFAKRSLYLKVRDRESYEFALASVAAAIDIQNNSIRSVRIALGGVATKPWRAYEAEDRIIGLTPDKASFRAAAELALEDAKPRGNNAFKVQLAKRTIVRALSKLSDQVLRMKKKAEDHDYSSS
jgi:xanthine dehydrogenase YagS FAD-binding subunit